MYEALGYAAYAKLYDVAVKFTRDVNPAIGIPAFAWTR